MKSHGNTSINMSNYQAEFIASVLSIIYKNLISINTCNFN